MKITIFGTGYVGLVTGACLAEAGNSVICVDIDEDKVAALCKGQIPIYEPGLESLCHDNAQAGRLEFSTDARKGVDHGEMIFIAVGTPPSEDGSADLRHVLDVASIIGEHMQGHKIVIAKSTVPVGTATMISDTVSMVLEQRGVTLGFDVISNPEFLKEGSAISDFMKPDRIVVGCSNHVAGERVRSLYRPFVKNHDVILIMDNVSAELTKYAANAMLATKISFMNEIANVAERVGADVEQVRIGMGYDSRIGFAFIYPGAGYGGSCFPKDVRALAQTAAEFGYETDIINAVEAVNKRQKRLLFEKINAHFSGQLKGRTIALWGLAFKPNTDDMREAPSRNLIDELVAAGAAVRAYDPEAGGEAIKLYHDNSSVEICADRDSALQGADALAVITEWKSFWAPDFDLLRQQLSEPVIFDGRNIYDPATLQQQGFTLYSIGRRAFYPQEGTSENG